MLRYALGLAMLVASPALAQTKELENAPAAVNELLSATRRPLSVVDRLGRRVAKFGEAAVTPLIAALETSTEPRRTILALRALKSIRSPRSASAVLALCTKEPAEVRAEAIATACNIPGANLAPVLPEAIRASDLQVRRRAWDGVRTLSGKELRPFLAAAVMGVADPDFWIRGRCLRILSEAPPTDGSRDPLIRTVPRVLGKLDRAAAIALFRVIARVRTKDLDGVASIALTLGSVHAKVAAFAAAADLATSTHVPLARELCRDGDPDLAKAAVGYLARRRDVKSIPMLVGLLESSREKSVREASAVALRRLSGRTFGYDVQQWREWLASAPVR
ncbi:MAG: hypothetical protein CMJ83_16945 [Planctomycetes bacterium]|nr:hypothetical protein [Planctomycetota bacterium]